MTPSNANTSELAKDLCERLDAILIEESPMHPFGCSTWEEASRVAIDMAKEVIVTAASAQAEREQYGRWLVAMANDRDAEKARADRLAKALERIGTIPLPEHDKDAWKYVHLAKRLARVALQQEE